MKIAALSALAIVGAASAATIYDNTGMWGAGSYFTGNGNTTGGAAIFGVDYDLQVADDFSNTGSKYLTGAACENATFGLGYPVQGVRVEIFPDIGGAPGEAPIHSGITSSFTTTTLGGDLFGLVGVRVDADISGFGWTIGTGTYWMTVQGVSMGGDWGYTYAGGDPFGANRYFRDGGVDHGNGLGGGYGSNDFFSAGDGGGSSVALFGRDVPAPAGLALVGLGGLVAVRRRR